MGHKPRHAHLALRLFFALALPAAGCESGSTVTETGAVIRVIVPNGADLQSPDSVEYVVLCREEGATVDNIAARGFMTPPDDTAQGIDSATWSTTAALPSGRCVMGTRSLRLNCNDCAVWEPFVIEEGVVVDISFVMLCTLSFCENGELLFSAEVPDRVSVDAQLSYRVTCNGEDDGADNVFENVVLVWAGGGVFASPIPLWRDTAYNLAEGPCTIAATVVGAPDGQRCTGTRDFEIRRGRTTELMVEIVCE